MGSERQFAAGARREVVKMAMQLLGVGGACCVGANIGNNVDSNDDMSRARSAHRLD
jgi:hypothetical protein